MTLLTIYKTHLFDSRSHKLNAAGVVFLEFSFRKLGIVAFNRGVKTKVGLKAWIVAYLLGRSKHCWQRSCIHTFCCSKRNYCIGALLQHAVLLIVVTACSTPLPNLYATSNYKTIFIASTLGNSAHLIVFPKDYVVDASPWKIDMEVMDAIRASFQDDSRFTLVGSGETPAYWQPRFQEMHRRFRYGSAYSAVQPIQEILDRLPADLLLVTIPVSTDILGLDGARWSYIGYGRGYFGLDSFPFVAAAIYVIDVKEGGILSWTTLSASRRYRWDRNAQSAGLYLNPALFDSFSDSEKTCIGAELADIVRDTVPAVIQRLRFKSDLPGSSLSWPKQEYIPNFTSVCDAVAGWSNTPSSMQSRESPGDAN